MIDYLAKYAVLVRPNNVDGTSRVFDVISGIASAAKTATFATVERECEPGTILALLTQDGPLARVQLARVEYDAPLNVLDDQPALGDEVVLTCSPADVFFLAGGTFRFVGEPGDLVVVNPATGLVLALWPVLSGDLNDRVTALEHPADEA